MKIFIRLMIFLFLLGSILAGTYIYAFSPYMILSPQSENSSNEFLLTKPLVINFTKPIDTKYYKDNIKIVPETPMKAVINDELNQITITPKLNWKVNTQYSVIIPEGRAKNFMQISSQLFKFKTVDYPKVIEATPKNGEKDVRLDIEDPIIVKFDKSTEGFFVDFRLSPKVEVSYQNNEEKNQFNILPKDSLQEGVLYSVEVFIKPKESPDTAYVKIYETSFTTLPPKPKTWSQDLNERVEQAKTFTQARIMAGKYIDVNLATQIMTIFENGKIINSFLISSGKRGMDTPKGEHQIYNKHPRPWSKKYGLYMPNWMAITSDGKFGIHELPEWPGGYKEGQNHLGIPVSHGCMRLGVGPAETVYNWAEIGTPVLVY